MTDLRMPARDDCVLPHLLDRHGRESPDRIFAVFENGESWSYATTRDFAMRTAAALRAERLGTGDKLISWLPNGPSGLRCFLAAGYCGAVYVGINTAYKGALLEHVLELSDAEVMVAHPDLVDRLLDIGRRGRIRTVFTSAAKVASDRGRFAGAGIELLSTDLLDREAGPIAPPDLQPWDAQSICFTSGTTGPSKAVVSSYMHLYTMGVECLEGIGPEDRHIVNLPLFHAGGTLTVYGALARGASIVLLEAFQTDTFLDICRRTGATATILLGAMTGFLLKRPPSPADRDHGLRQVLVLPLGDDGPTLRERFGVDVLTTFNMSEVSAPLFSERNPVLAKTCGRVRPGMDVRIVDANDCEMPIGAVGELIVRADAPWTLFSEYYRMPEATAKAWRNGWFHTGDAFRRDADGNYFFVDRVKDSIRRRGENISSFELECEVLRFAGLAEAAAVGVPSADSEEEVLLVLVPQPGTSLDRIALIDHLQDRVPHFMVPRYLRTVDALPKTPTSKVEKHVLRAQGITEDTWDREAAGIRIRKEKLR